MLLMIDNYDSFTYNLVHYFQHLNEEVVVARNDEITIDDISAMQPQKIVISPGPCDPDKAGLSLQIIASFAGKIPILGVCLGHQCIAQHFGGVVEKAKQVMHGKTSLIQHNQRNLFADLNLPLQVTRYHSLVVNKSSLPECLSITAWTEDAQGNFDEIMAIEHNTLAIMGVQFHPESILTEQGHQLLANFINKY
ncbi:aminodeoxychorismate/anthranilate synthase component II [Thalassotalea sp. HSM 43]|uniref:anthranilate synthase component II n=1 Tax=Thalassotalea sp. HSM 43 TaxID=2552945 RepID=UPI00107FF260|nr:aminodeoxychorismate/anthranilate synthase component II [Thalassotalea sp. HSM 43]QBY03914.1 aminodeoxychorismate/anthranilate synthase component II [Thalassotalea sp. HSM 43]